MSIIITENVYVWCEGSQCVGVLDGRYGCGTTLGGPLALYCILDEMLRARLPAVFAE